jgi:hypothetical protein
MEPRGREKQSMKKEKQNKNKKIVKKTKAGSLYVETLQLVIFFAWEKVIFRNVPRLKHFLYRAFPHTGRFCTSAFDIQFFLK